MGNKKLIIYGILGLIVYTIIVVLITVNVRNNLQQKNLKSALNEAIQKSQDRAANTVIEKSVDEEALKDVRSKLKEAFSEDN